MTFDLPSDSEEEIPDWLNDIRGGETPSEPETPQAPAEEPTSESDSSGEESDTDWLNNIRSAEADDSASGDASEIISSDEDDSEDWLDNIRSQEEETGVGSEDDGDEDLIDRIHTLQDEDEEAQTSDQLEEDDSSSGIISDADQTDAEAEESPDWMSGILTEEPSTESQPAFEPADEVEEEEEQEVENTGSLPSWLVQMKQTGALDQADLPPSSTALLGDSEDSTTGVEVPGLDLSLGELPDWISDPSEDIDLAEEFPTFEGEAETSDDEEDAGDVPGWVQGMRPSDIPATAEKVLTGAEETVGPLAGLYNLIPAEPEIGQFVKAPSFSFSLDISETQKKNAALFEELIAEEEPTGTAARVARLLTAGALRWAISILLLFAILVPILLDSETSNLPENLPPTEIRDFHFHIDRLGPDDVVLVAYDFQPGSYAEMSAASSAVMDHVLLKSAKLVLVSTNPTGTATGELMLAETQAENHTYIKERSYQNLGYLSGGISGLRLFGSFPRDAIVKFIDVDDERRNVWSTGLLQTVYSLNDFKLIIVMTDDIETARNWIEQVQPNLLETPLLIVLNAQTEPLIRPYYSSEPKQVFGFVAGLRAGLYYEQLINRGHVAQEYWNSYSAGLGMVASLIVFGSAFSFIANVLARRRAKTK